MKQILSLMLTLCLAGVAEAQKVSMKELPLSVQKTVQEQLKGAALVAITKEVEDGKTVYELETKVKGRARDLMLDVNGTILSVEEEVSLETIPAPAKAAILKAAAGARIEKVETLTETGKVNYEAAYAKGTQKLTVTVSADGKVQK